VVEKLWGYFIPTPPPRGTARALERMYLANGRDVRPLLGAILRHPHLYDPDRRMVKPPVVQAAGMLRAVGRGIDTTAWSWLCDQAGQMLFEPPNVAGWDDDHWLDTATFRARWFMASQICNAARIDADRKVSGKPSELVARAARFWAGQPLSRPTRNALERYAATAMRTADQEWKREAYPALTENALRMLVAVSPDFLTS
jgi:uncharacterized protein (DUF1800 family)